jgi:hypothetical protein
MLSSEQLEEKYRKKGVVRGGGSLYLYPREAKSFIRDCYANGLGVSHIEGLVIESNGIRPLMDQIADFLPYGIDLPFTDWQGYRAVTQDYALSFIDSVPAELGLVFEIEPIDQDLFEQEMMHRAEHWKAHHKSS